MKLAYAFLCLSVVVLLPARLVAQSSDEYWMPGSVVSDEARTPEAERPHTPLSAALEFGLTSRSDDRSELWVLSPVASVAYRLHERWALSLDWGFAIAIEAPVAGDNESRVGSGNPMLSAVHRLSALERNRFDVWLGATAPLAWLADGTKRGFSRAMYAHALATRGLWNAWLWAPEQIALASGVTWAFRPPGDVRLRAEGALGVTLPLDDVTQDTADLFVQLAFAAELSGGPLAFGLRLQSVLMTADSDPLQLAIVPYARANFDAWAVGLRWVINLDEPLGFVGAGLDAWGLLFSLEVTP